MWFIALVLAFPSPVTVSALSGVVTRQVLQRNGSNQCSIPISGTITGTADTVQLLANPFLPYPGTQAPYVSIGAPSGGAFSGSITVSPGWYTITARALSGGYPVGESSISRIGCGEVFITGGQSNSIPYAANNSPQSPVNDDVSFFTTAGVWTWGSDTTLATTPNGSVWPPFMDALATYLQMPVAVGMTGIANTTIAQWVSTYYSSSMKPMIQSLPAGGFRAILWMQGESDAVGSTTQSAYQTGLRSIVASSRSDAGFTVPWGIASPETYDNGVSSNAAAITAAQAAVASDASNFAGPACDSYTTAYRLASPDGVHWNGLGDQTIGPLWYTAIKAAFAS